MFEVVYENKLIAINKNDQTRIIWPNRFILLNNIISNTTNFHKIKLTIELSVYF